MIEKNKKKKQRKEDLEKKSKETDKIADRTKKEKKAEGTRHDDGCRSTVQEKMY